MFSLNPTVQSASRAVTSVVEEDNLTCAALIRNHRKVSLLGCVPHYEKICLLNSTVQSASRSVMSVEEKDKVASTALIGNCSKVSLSIFTPHHFILGDDVNADKEAHMCECYV
jgi:hypothetical protein